MNRERFKRISLRHFLIRFAIYGFFICVSFFSSWSVVLAAQNPWQLRINKEGITVYTRKVEASAILEYKANMTVKADLAKLISFFEEARNMPQWYYQCVQAEPISNSGSGQDLFYFVLSLPWPVAERDCVYNRVKSLDPVSGQLTYIFSAVSGKLPAQKGRVRVIYLNSIWRLTPLKDGRIAIYFQQHSDPGGIIPAFLVNKLSVDIPFYSFKNLRRMLSEINLKEAK